MRHILTFDVEDWHQLCHRHLTGSLIPPHPYLEPQVDQILECLAETNTRATFFVLGLVAQSLAPKIREMADLGHEVASHGHSHRPVYTQSPQEFRSDVKRSVDLLEQITGRKVRGYRAPEFTITRKNLWALDELCDMGLAYDSSLFPIRYWRYGIPGCPRRPFVYCGKDQRRIFELPLSTVLFQGVNLPIAGGGYFRLLPEKWLARAVRKLESEELPMVIYLHPYELSEKPLSMEERAIPGDLRVRVRARWLNFWFNLGRNGVRQKLTRLLQQHQFTTCKEFIDDENSRQSAPLFQFDL